MTPEEESLMQLSATISQTAIESAQQRFVTKVFWWMAVALATTGGISFYIMASPALLATVLRSPGTIMALVVAELGLVIALSAAIQKISAAVATALFFLYAAFTGVTLSVVFAVYTMESLATAFFASAGTFVAMGIYGLATRRDLTSVGNLAFMGLIGIIIASLVGVFFPSSMINTVTAYVGVLVFVGLTAYDAQKIKRMGPLLAEGSEAEQKGAILGALRLYLDFLNLFLMMLRILGRRR
jgi:uncharacterized protein